MDVCLKRQNVSCNFMLLLLLQQFQSWELNYFLLNYSNKTKLNECSMPFILFQFDFKES